MSIEKNLEQQHEYLGRLDRLVESAEAHLQTAKEERDAAHAIVAGGGQPEQLGWSHCGKVLDHPEYRDPSDRFSLVIWSEADEASEPLCDLLDPDTELVLWVMGIPSPEGVSELLKRHAEGLVSHDSGPGDYIVRVATGKVITGTEAHSLWNEQDG